MRFNVLFERKGITVSFSYYFIFDRILIVLVAFKEKGHFVKVIVRSAHLINLHFWTYLSKRGEIPNEYMSGFMKTVLRTEVPP